MIEMLQRNLTAVESEKENPQADEELDPRVLSSVLVSTKLARTDDCNKDPHARLLELMHSNPVRALLDSATLLAKRQGLPPQEALHQIISNLQEIDNLWSKVLLKEGLARLSSQYH